MDAVRAGQLEMINETQLLGNKKQERTNMKFNQIMHEFVYGYDQFDESVSPEKAKEKYINAYIEIFTKGITHFLEKESAGLQEDMRNDIFLAAKEIGTELAAMKLESSAKKEKPSFVAKLEAERAAKQTTQITTETQR